MTTKSKIVETDFSEVEERVMSWYLSLDMTGAQFKAAREELGLTQTELLPLLGYQRDPRYRKHISEMERGVKTIQPTHARLMKAYLSGYRPPDWPRDKLNKSGIKEGRMVMYGQNMQTEPKGTPTGRKPSEPEFQFIKRET